MNGRYLILGASGYLGRQLYRRIGSQRAVATFHAKPLDGALRFDATSENLKGLFRKTGSDFDAAFLLYGVTRIDTCALDPEGSARVNVESHKRVLDDLFDAGIKPIFASSDAVYDGSRGPWSETDPTHPILTYGRQKLAVEQYIFASGRPAVIARLSKIIGAEIESGNPLLDMARQIEEDKPIRCASDQIFSPIDSRDAVTSFIQLAQGSANGLFNVCGPRAVTRLELLQTLIEHLQVQREKPHPVVSPCSIRDFSFAEPRPLNVSMNPAKLLRTIEIVLTDIATTCRSFAENYRNPKHSGSPG